MQIMLETIKDDFQAVLRTLESLFTFFVLIHVRRHKVFTAFWFHSKVLAKCTVETDLCKFKVSCQPP